MYTRVCINILRYTKKDITRTYVFTCTFVDVCLLTANSNLQPHLSANLRLPVYSCTQVQTYAEGLFPRRSTLAKSK